MPRFRRSSTAALVALGLADAPAGAQTGGGLAGLLRGGGLPDIASTGAGNAAGLLSYCLKNQLIGGGASGALGSLAGSATGDRAPAGDGSTATGAASVLSALTGRRGVAATPAFDAGQRGTIVTGQGRKLPIGGLGDAVKGRVCSLVLQHARSLL